MFPLVFLAKIIYYDYNINFYDYLWQGAFL